MANRIGKLVLVDADDVPPERITKLSGGAEGGGQSTADYVKQQVQSSSVSPLEKEIIKTDYNFKSDISEILKKPLPWNMIVLEILQYVNRYLDRIRRRDEEQRDSILAERKPSTSASVSVQPPLQPPPVVQIDPQSVLSYGKETQPFSTDNITKPLESRIVPRFKLLLERLQTKSGFSWNPETGQVKINRTVLPNSDIRDLVLHQVKQDIGDPPSDAPASFRRFSTFLKTKSINSNPVTRAADVTVSTRQAANEVPARKRSRTDTLTGSGKGRKPQFVRY